MWVMHIALVTRTYPSRSAGDGIGVYVWHMARGLVDLGHEVTVITGGDTDESDSEIARLRILRCLDSSVPSPIPSQWLSTLLAEQAADVVEFPEYCADGPAFQRDFPRFPTVVRLHSGATLCYEGNNPWWKVWARRVLPQAKLRETDRRERESVLLAHAVSAPTQCMAEQPFSRGWRAAYPPLVVPNPFGGWPGFEVPTTRSSQTVALPGRVDLLKGADLYPALMARVWREVPAAVFHIIGQVGRRWGGESWSHWLYRRIPQSKHRQVVVCGGVPYLEMPAKLAPARVAAFMSTWESFSYTLVEAMSLGLACVVGSAGGAQQIGTHAKHLFNIARNPAAIAEATCRLLLDHDLAAKVAGAGREHVKASLAPDLVAGEMMHVYRTAISRAHSEWPQAA